MSTEQILAKKNIRNLLGYAEEILKAGEKVVSDLSVHAVATFYEHEIATLEGVSVPKEDGWLRVARLHETASPVPEEAHLVWRMPARPGTGPFEPPKLAPTHMVSVSPEDATELVVAGLAVEDDIMPPKGDHAEGVDGVDVLLHLANMSEFAAAFEEWLTGPWAAWERTERPRRRSIAFYNRLFEIQQRSSSMGDDTPVEMIFGVGLARWAHADGRINAPLIEAAVELELEKDGAIVVRPRVQAPRLALRPFEELDIGGVGRLQKDASLELERSYDDPDVGFSPHERVGFEHVLRMCHARLASDAVYEPDARAKDDRAPPAADGKLRITDGWVLYVRQRSSNFRCDDIRRLKQAVENVEDSELPPPAIRMTSRPTDAQVDADDFDLTDTRIGGLPDFPAIGIAPPSGSGAAASKDDEKTYFFPLPYNDDQIEIVRRLELPEVSGVVVQGPPGTGKTHTIANIVSHYMATGRRVLVSAHEPEALAAIQGKLPASIRDLAISVIRSDREGARQLEQAVEILASQVKSIDRQVYHERRISLERQLAEIRAELAKTDEGTRECARLNLTAIGFRGAELMPMELAAKVEEERDRHSWFADRFDAAGTPELRFGDAEIAEAGLVRRELGRDIAYSANELPNSDELPDVPRLLAAHVAIAAERRADALSKDGELPFVSYGPTAGIEEARSARAWLDEAHGWHSEATADAAWLNDLYLLLVGAKSTHESLKTGLGKLCLEWTALCDRGRMFVMRGVTASGVETIDETFDSAVEAYADGRKPFGMFSFGKAAVKAKALLDEVRVDGVLPAEAAAWKCVRDYRAWRRDAHAFLGRWSTTAKVAGFPAFPTEGEAANADLLRLGALVERMNALLADVPRQKALLGTLFPYGVDVEAVVSRLETSLAREALGASLAKESHADARSVARALAHAAAAADRPFHRTVADLAGSLGDPNVAPRELAEGWREVLDEARRLYSLQDRRHRLEEIASSVAESGAPAWAAGLLRESAVANDPLTPADWKASWEWALAESRIRRLSDRGTLAALSARMSELEGQRRNLMAEIVRVRTFIGLKKGITERVAAALQKFAMKVRQLGGGTGKSAERHRRGIREATLEAASAVPCWILPEWRVAEQLPSELAAFDLVIIDEASQSDITALPAVLRGKKLLVVGDDKQVSPSAVGMEERTVVQLRETFLRGMDIANFLEPTTSLYDLASMTFPGSVVMLREHFRCVEPIIAFSSRFYPKALVPLRVPTAEERLDPPLIDVYVPDGRKVRDVNAAEADYIVGEIARLTVLPEFANRSIGVISMIGEKQAKAVQDLLVEKVGTEIIARHHIMCGNASTFQGQERDIVFLSLVACPKTARAQTARLMEQRFNVALSRARDRMYLVRSVAASMLQPKDLKLAVIEHFRNPMADTIAVRDKAVLEETESGFEREVGGLLLDRGYRVRPQVRVGGYRIDFVIEGEGDRRLAVELDGDRYHGPERWFEDVHRQRALERLGWTFWRCWGSHWLADRQGCLDDLLATLSRLGIEPVGGEMSPQVWTEHRVVGEDKGLGEAAQAAAAETGRPTLATVNEPSEELLRDLPTAFARGDNVVEMGDTVIVRFADDNHVRRFRLSRGAHDPAQGEVGAGKPIVDALLGNGLEEEVDLMVGGKERRVIIEKITKAA